MTVTYTVRERELSEEERRTLAALLMRQGKLSAMYWLQERPDLGRDVIRVYATREDRKESRA